GGRRADADEAAEGGRDDVVFGVAEVGHEHEELDELDAVVIAACRGGPHRAPSSPAGGRADHAEVPAARECSDGGTPAVRTDPEACTMIDSRSPSRKRPARAAVPSAWSTTAGPCRAASATASAIRVSMRRAPPAAASTRYSLAPSPRARKAASDGRVGRGTRRSGSPLRLG